MNNIFFLRATKSAHFLWPPEFALGPPQELGLMQIPGAIWPKISQPINFSIFQL